MKTQPFYIKGTYLLAFFFLLFSGLYYLKVLVVPIFLSALLSILLYPMAKRLESGGMHRFLASLILVLLFLGILGVFGFLFYKQILSFIQNIDQLVARLNNKLAELQAYITRKTSMSSGNQLQWVQENITDWANVAKNTLRFTANTFIMLIPVPFYIFFMLLYRDKLKVFIFRVTPIENHHTVAQIIGRVKKVIHSYLKGIVIVIFIMSVTLSVGLKLIGIPYAIFLGVMSAFLNVVPYVGIFTAMVISAAVATLTKDSSLHIFGVLILYWSVHIVEANILTPNIVGSKVSINPMIIIMALIGGEMAWGIWGMILFIPILGVLKVMFDSMEEMQPMGFLLGTEGSEEHQISMGGTYRRFLGLFNGNYKKRARRKD